MCFLANLLWPLLFCPCFNSICSSASTHSTSLPVFDFGLTKRSEPVRPKATLVPIFIHLNRPSVLMRKGCARKEGWKWRGKSGRWEREKLPGGGGGGASETPEWLYPYCNRWSAIWHTKRTWAYFPAHDLFAITVANSQTCLRYTLTHIDVLLIWVDQYLMTPKPASSFPAAAALLYCLSLFAPSLCYAYAAFRQNSSNRPRLYGVWFQCSQWR